MYEAGYMEFGAMRKPADIPGCMNVGKLSDTKMLDFTLWFLGVTL